MVATCFLYGVFAKCIKYRLSWLRSSHSRLDACNDLWKTLNKKLSTFSLILGLEIWLVLDWSLIASLFRGKEDAIVRRRCIAKQTYLLVFS